MGAWPLNGEYLCGAYVNDLCNQQKLIEMQQINVACNNDCI